MLTALVLRRIWRRCCREKFSLFAGAAACSSQQFGLGRRSLERSSGEQLAKEARREELRNSGERKPCERFLETKGLRGDKGENEGGSWVLLPRSEVLVPLTSGGLQLDLWYVFKPRCEDLED